jgi:putative ABC transport system ATP-binding protein
VVFGLGLDQEAGPGGRLLMPAQKSAIVLVRCLIKRPKILIADQLDLMFPDGERSAILDAIRTRMAGHTLIVAIRNAPSTEGFDVVVTTRGNRVESVARPSAPKPAMPVPEEIPQDDHAEVQALRDVPMFAMLDTPRLKLIAFTSERKSFVQGQILFRQGEPSDAAYVVLSGSVDAFLEQAAGRLHLSSNGRYSIIGEMGVISGAPRSATLVATTDVVTLKIAKDIFLDLIAELPPMALAVMRDQIRRLNVADARLAISVISSSPPPSNKPSSGAKPGRTGDLDKGRDDGHGKG